MISTYVTVVTLGRDESAERGSGLKKDQTSSESYKKSFGIAGGASGFLSRCCHEAFRHVVFRNPFPGSMEECICRVVDLSSSPRQLLHFELLQGPRYGIVRMTQSSPQARSSSPSPLESKQRIRKV